MSIILAKAEAAQKIANRTTEAAHRLRHCKEQERQDIMFLIDLVIETIGGKKEQQMLRADIHSMLEGPQDKLDRDIAAYKANLAERDAENTDTLKQLCLFDMADYADDDEIPDPPEAPEPPLVEGEMVEAEDVMITDPPPVYLQLGPAQYEDAEAEVLEDSLTQPLEASDSDDEPESEHPDPIEAQKAALGHLADTAAQTPEVAEFRKPPRKTARKAPAQIPHDVPIA